MRPTSTMCLVLSRATNAGKDLDMCTRMSIQLQWLLTITHGSAADSLQVKDKVAMQDAASIPTLFHVSQGV